MSKRNEKQTDLIKFTIHHEGRGYDLWRPSGGGEPLAKDLDVAAWLEFGKTYKIRDLIERHRDSLGPLLDEESFFPTVGNNPQRRGKGRPGKTYYLTEAQALFLAAKSETAKATQVLKALIVVFLAVKNGSPEELKRLLEENRALREDHRSLKADLADLRAMLHSGLLAPIGESEKGRLTTLAGKVADLVMALLPGVAALTTEERATEWRQKFADVLQEAADVAKVGGRPWHLLTAAEGMEIRSFLERRHEKLARRVRRLRKKNKAGSGGAAPTRQLKLVG